MKTIFPPHPRQLICNAVPALMGSHSDFSQFSSSVFTAIVELTLWTAGDQGLFQFIFGGLQQTYLADYSLDILRITKFITNCSMYNVQFGQFRLSERFPYFITKWKIINIFEFLWNWKGMILKLILIYYINYIHISIKSLLQLNKNI